MGELGDHFDSSAAIGISLRGIGDSAKRIFGGGFTKAGADWVEVNVLCHLEEGVSASFDDDGLKLLGPQGAKPAMGFVEPDGHAKFKNLHEHGEVVHALEKETACCRSFRRAGAEERFKCLRAIGSVGRRSGEKNAVSPEDFIVWYPGAGCGRDTAKDVDVVGHYAIGDNIDAAEVGYFLQNGSKHRLFPIAEKMLPSNRPGNAMME